MKHNYPLYFILALTIAVRIIFAFGWHEIWWDSGVYIGMGKYIYSGGDSGLWEHIRPPLLPIVLGLFWKLGLDTVLFGRLLEIVLMGGIVWLTYLLAKHWWDEKTAIVASLIVSLSPIFYYLSFHQYTEIPSTFLVLLALWLFVKEKYLWAGIGIGLAFLAKFPTALYLPIILLALAFSKKWKPALHATAGFAIIAFPYFIWSAIAYGSPFATISAAQETIRRVLGCNVLRAMPWWQYAWWLVFSETKLHFLALPGIFALYKKWSKKHMLFVLSLAIPALYFTQLHCRDYRYLTLFLPFAAMLTALGIVWIYEQFKIKKKSVFIILVIILGALMLCNSMIYYYSNERQTPDIVAENYFSYLSDNPLTGEIWTANPIIAAYSDQKLEKIYYPLFGAEASQNFTDYALLHTEKIGAVLLDNCGGGIICPPDEPECGARMNVLIATLDAQFVRVFDKQSNGCWYRIWATSSQK